MAAEMAIDKIYILIKVLYLSQKEFCEKTNIPATLLSNAKSRKSKLNEEVIGNILEAYPQINPLWFLRGKGNIFLDESQGKGINLSNVDVAQIGNIGYIHGNPTIQNSNGSDDTAKQNEAWLREKEAMLREKEALEKEIAMLRSSLADKDKIIKLLDK